MMKFFAFSMIKRILATLALIALVMSAYLIWARPYLQTSTERQNVK